MEAQSAREPGSRSLTSFHLEKVMLAVIILMYHVTLHSSPTTATFCVFSLTLFSNSIYCILCIKVVLDFSLAGRGIVRGMLLRGMDLNEYI